MTNYERESDETKNEGRFATGQERVGGPTDLHRGDYAEGIRGPHASPARDDAGDFSEGLGESDLELDLDDLPGDFARGQRETS